MVLKEKLSQYWLKIQKSLFPFLEEELGELTEKERKLVTILEMVKIEKFTVPMRGLYGRPPKERAAIARAFVAKAAYNLPTTTALLDRLAADKKIRRICGWEKKSEIPHESTFSRAFAEFAQSQLPARVHEALIKENLGEEIIQHISRDSTEIEAREKPIKAVIAQAATGEKKSQCGGHEPITGVRKRGRPKKGEEPVKDPT
jgi:hypothetical protein